MARAEKGAGKGSATKRKERRQAKFNPGPGPQSVKPIGGADAAGFDDANVEAKKKAKSPGKLSKKRKAEGASNDVGDAPAAAAIKSKKSKKLIGSDAKKPVSKKHDTAPAWTNQTRREQKDWANEQKALQKPNFTLIQDITALWERLRVKKISAEDKRKLVAAIFKASRGKCAILANNHKASRVVQALLKYGTEDEKASVYAECAPHLAALAKSLYGHFIVQKLVDATPKEKLPELLANVKGRVRVLAKHPVGSQVLEALYWPAPNACKRDMECEFYGSEFAMFGAAGLAQGKAASSLREAMLAKPIAQRQGMLREMNKTLLPILEKGLVSPSLIHKVLCEYLQAGGPGTRYEAAHSIAGPALLRMIHTREGAHAVNMMMSHAGAKQRKMVLKALKGNVARIARDEHGAAAVMCMLDCVDDTTQLGKVIVNELKAEGLADLAEDGAARRVLLHLLRPRSRRYTHPHVLATIPDQDEVVKSVADAKASLTAQGHAVGGEDDEDADEGAEEGAEGADVDMDDEMDDDDIMDDEFDDEDEDEVDDTKGNKKKANGMTKFKSKAAEAAAAVDDSDDEDGVAGGTNAGTSDSIDFGIAKKPNDARRTEIFGQQGKLGAALVNACEPNAAAMLRSVAGCDVLVETCAGGAGNVLTKAVGVERLGELHAAVAEAVRKSVAGEEDDEADENETDGGKPREPLHTGFFSSRALRRMVLDIPGDEPHGSETAPSFAAALWTGAIADHLEEWVGGHGAKVVAAVVKAGDAATVRAATAALTKVIEGKSVEEWTAGFFRARDGDAGAKKGGVNGKSKKKTEPVAAPKTPAKTPAKTPGKKTGSKKETKEEAPPSSEGSMKKKKFSPRQTRGQRAAKAGK